MSTPSLKVVVAVTSPIAFELLNKDSIVHSSFGIARAFSIETSLDTHIAIAVTEGDAHRVADFGCEILICEPNSPASLAAALNSAKQALADAQRALAKGDFAAYGQAQDRLKSAINAAITAQQNQNKK